MPLSAVPIRIRRILLLNRHPGIDAGVVSQKYLSKRKPALSVMDNVYISQWRGLSPPATLKSTDLAGINPATTSYLFNDNLRVTSIIRLMGYPATWGNESSIKGGKPKDFF